MFIQTGLQLHNAFHFEGSALSQLPTLCEKKNKSHSGFPRLVSLLVHMERYVSQMNITDVTKRSKHFKEESKLIDLKLLLFEKTHRFISG